jgi:glycosyltransferase involved in cell wall biosynthesis
MRHSSPRVSLGLPVYNGQAFLKTCLDSVLAQTYEDFELIISDNASTDQTEALCRDYAARDSRIRYFRNATNLGANPNFNRTLELAQGEYFKWVAVDDILAPTYVSCCVKVLDQDPSVVLCHSQTIVIDRNGHPLPFDAVSNGFADAQGNIYPGTLPKGVAHDLPHERYGAVLSQISWCFEMFGLMRLEQLRTTRLENFYGADKALLCYVSLLGRFVEVPEPLFFNRRHAQQSTSLSSNKQKAIWSSTHKRKQHLYMPSRGTYGYLEAIWRAKLGWPEQLACLGALIRYVCDRQWSKLGILLRRLG